MIGTEAHGRDVIQVDELVAGYGEMTVLEGISLAVTEGECVLVAGPNGAGKTTLLRAIMGLVDISGGVLRMQGVNLAEVPTHRLASLGIGVVPEGRRVFGRLTVYQNLVLGAHNWLGWARPNQEFAKMVSDVVDIFPDLGARPNMPAGQLSGGQQQMVAIARALMTRPRLLLLDEPSLGLAPRAARSIFDGLTRFRTQNPGVGILLVEQNLKASLRIADSAYVIRSGRVVWESTRAGSLDERKMGAAFFGESRLEDSTGELERS